jgi:nucleotide-binding universal stress UspA family protein
MSTNRVIVIPLIGRGDARAAIGFGHRIAVSRQAILQLLYLSEKEEDPAVIISRFHLLPEDLFNSVVRQIHCPKEEFDEAILAVSALPEVEMLIFSDGDDLPNLTKKIVEKASSPILLTQSEFAPTVERGIRKILVPIDCTPSSAVAIESAVLFAEETGASLHVLHIATMETANEAGSLPIGPYMDQPQHDWPLWIREFWDRFIICVKEIAPQINFKLHISRGEIDEEILLYAKSLECDLVTLTAGGSSVELLNRLIRELPCPLLLVQPGKVRTKLCDLTSSFAA